MKAKILTLDNRAVIEVTKEFTFDSCHNLLNYEGACKRLHGHTYKLQVTVKGTCNDIGMVIDFKDLKHLVKIHVIDSLDHEYLNEKFDCNTTAENMVVAIFNTLSPCICDVTNNRAILTEIKLWETPTSFASYRGGVR